jgi:hypothetical protein
MIRLFVGYDPREARAYHVFCQSVIETSSVPVQFIPLHAPMLQGFDGQRDGTNAFIYSRYLIPSLCDFQGWAIFADGDMLARGDIAHLWALRNPECAVQYVHHDYRTKHARKYIGTPLEADNADYPKKNCSSLVLWNCAHPAHRILTREFVEEAGGKFLHRFEWLRGEECGALPQTWNHLVGEYNRSDASIAHYTLGVPGFKHYRNCEHADAWHQTYHRTVNLIGEQSA